MEKYQNSKESTEDSYLDKPENNKPEKLIASEPRLRDIYKTLLLLKPEELPGGERAKYQDLYKEVKPYHTMLEFTDNVRETVRDYIAKRIPKLKEGISSIEDLDEKSLLDALTHNWFEEIEEVSGERREVLLAVAAHIVKHIETFTEKKLLGEADSEKLAELGLDSSIRDLLMELLDASAEADPLFVRFLAYSQLSGKPSEEASSTGLHLPGDSKTHTIAELFPHETQFIARRFAGILEKDSEWKKRSGGDAFVRYLEILQKFYESTDPKEVIEYQKEINRRYAEVLKTDFPVFLTASMEGYYKEPYLDPELKVSVATSEANRETETFNRAKGIMAKSLDEIGAGEFAANVQKMDVKSSIVLGGFGVGLTFNAVAQEDPAYQLFLNEQIRGYDRIFPTYIDIITNSREAFSNISKEERNNRLEQMSRMSTMLHEFGHPVYPSDSEGGKRLGRKPLTVIDEVKAETLWRGLIPDMVKEEGFVGDKEQWAVAMLISLMLALKDPEAYSDSAVYNLNDLFEQGVVEFKDGKLSITDIEKYYVTTKKLSKEVLSLYRDKEMTERKAAGWIKKRCVPTDALQNFISFAKSLSY